MSGIHPRRFVFVPVAILVLCLTAAAAWAAAGSGPQPGGPLVEVVLDASGSMRAALPDGRSRLETTTSAIEALAASLPRGFDLALRAFGHTAPRERHDCEDTELLVPFGRLDENRLRVGSLLRPVTARGLSPIGWVLGAAARDFPAGDPRERIVVLVSDGRETCAGDPCAAAQTLAASGGGRLIIHTVGLGADAAARDTLACMAEVSGGRFFDVPDGAGLAAALSAAVATPGGEAARWSGRGRLQLASPGPAEHDVIEAASSRKVATLGRTRSMVELSAGIYDVGVGQAAFLGVVVRPGEITSLKPAWIEVATPTVEGHDILDPETGQAVAHISTTGPRVMVLPGRYEVSFGEALWPMAVAGGQTLVLHPGVVVLQNAGPRYTYVFDAAGNRVGRLSNTQKWLPLPPGDYEIDLGERREPFTLEEGQRLELTR